jgi:hypothetical protein
MEDGQLDLVRQCRNVGDERLHLIECNLAFGESLQDASSFGEIAHSHKDLQPNFSYGNFSLLPGVQQDMLHLDRHMRANS